MNFEVENLIAIYLKKTRKDTIYEIKEMSEHLEDDEKELKELEKQAISYLLKGISDVNLILLRSIRNFNYRSFIMVGFYLLVCYNNNTILFIIEGYEK